MSQDRCAAHRRVLAVDAAYRAGDLDALLAALGEDAPAEFPNGRLPADLMAIGDHPLDYAIIWSPLRFVRELLELGADPNYAALDGFPSLLTAIDAPRPDRLEVMRLLLAHGADVGQRGLNDWTPLHHAVARRDIEAVRLLLAHRADPAARTRIDELTTPLEDAEAIGFTEAVEAMRRGST